jgi:hypothetical protein
MARAAPPVDQKQTSVSQNAGSDSSQLSRPERPSYGSYEDHAFSNRAIAQHWREVYDKAEYEGRHRFDPDYTWTAEEERKVVRKGSTQSDATAGADSSTVGLQHHIVGVDHVRLTRPEPQEHQPSHFRQWVPLESHIEVRLMFLDMLKDVGEQTVAFMAA